MDEALQGIPQLQKIVDDCVIYDSDFSSHTRHVRDVLQRCADKGISLNKDKFVFASQEAEFCGYILSREGYRVNPRITDAIRQFPKPGNITDMRSFFGLANQLANFTDTIAAKLDPLRPLLKTNNEFYWDATHDCAFGEVKEALSTSPVLAYYDHRRDTALLVGASRLKGLGFVLQQRQNDGQWRMVQAGSRFLSETESRYAMIEIELLGIVWAVKKCRMFLPHYLSLKLLRINALFSPSSTSIHWKKLKTLDAFRSRLHIPWTKYINLTRYLNFFYGAIYIPRRCYFYFQDNYW